MRIIGLRAACRSPHTRESAGNRRSRSKRLSTSTFPSPHCSHANTNGCCRDGVCCVMMRRRITRAGIHKLRAGSGLSGCGLRRRLAISMTTSWSAGSLSK